MCWALCNQNRDGLLFRRAPEVTLEHCCERNPAIEKKKKIGVLHEVKRSRSPTLIPAGFNVRSLRSITSAYVPTSHEDVSPRESPATACRSRRMQMNADVVFTWRPNASLFLNLREAVMHSTVSSQPEKQRRNKLKEELSGQTSLQGLFKILWRRGWITLRNNWRWKKSGTEGCPRFLLLLW